MSSTQVARQRSLDEETEAAGRAALWTMVGILVAFKIATTAVILIYVPGARALVLELFVAFHWPFLLAGIIFGTAPALFWLRLLRGRARRRRLLASEWSVD